MPSYETLCILSPELPETQVKEMIAWMQKIVEGANGTTVRMNEWGVRDLSHYIRKQRRGCYVLFEYDAPAAAVKELERNLRINENVLRFLSTVRKAPVLVPVPQPSSTPVASAGTENSPAEQ